MSAEIKGMGYEDLCRWLRKHRYTDPVLEHLAAKAARQTDTPDQPPTAARPETEGRS